MWIEYVELIIILYGFWNEWICYDLLPYSLLLLYLINEKYSMNSDVFFFSSYFYQFKIQDVFLMIRRKKTTIFTDAKDNTSVGELKKMIEGELK